MFITIYIQWTLPEKDTEIMLIKFDIYFDGDYWCARGIGVDIFT